MNYVKLWDSEGQCKNFSCLVMGTDHLIQGGWTGESQPKPTHEEVFMVLDEAAKYGINIFDTAPIYVGAVEHVLGKWRASRAEMIRNDNFYVSPILNPDRRLYALSKGGFPFDLSSLGYLPADCHSEQLLTELKERGILAQDALLTEDGSFPLVGVPSGTYASHLFCKQELITLRIVDELERTDKNLKEIIDLYIMHRDDGDAIGFQRVCRPQTPVQTIMHALSAPPLASEISILGWSNWQSTRINESLRIAEQSKDLLQPALNSPYFSLFEMGDITIHALGVQVTHAEMMNPEFQKGIKIMPYSPLGGFSILDQPAPQWENAKRMAHEKFLNRDPVWQNVYPAIFTQDNEARWHRVVRFTLDFNEKHQTQYAVDQMLNAYVLAHPRTDMLAIGAITPEQVRRTVQSLDLSKMLTWQDLDFLYNGVRS